MKRLKKNKKQKQKQRSVDMKVGEDSHFSLLRICGKLEKILKLA